MAARWQGISASIPLSPDPRSRCFLSSNVSNCTTRSSPVSPWQAWQLNITLLQMITESQCGRLTHSRLWHSYPLGLRWKLGGKACVPNHRDCYFHGDCLGRSSATSWFYFRQQLPTVPSKVNKRFTFTLAIFQGLAQSLLTLAHSGSASLDSQVGRLRKGGGRLLLFLPFLAVSSGLDLLGYINWLYKCPWGRPAT